MGIVKFPTSQAQNQNGFTLLETLIVVVILGFSSTITAPAYLSFFETYQLNIAQDKVHQGMRLAQSKAMQTNTAWRFGVRENSGVIEWSVYQDGATNIQWQILSKSLTLDDETTLRKSSLGIHSTKFDYEGNARILGRVTLTGKYYSTAKRCVIVSTLLGATRKGRGHTKPNSSGRHCY